MAFYVLSNKIMAASNYYKLGYTTTSEIILMEQYRALFDPVIHIWYVSYDARKIEKHMLSVFDNQRQINGKGNKTEWVMTSIEEIHKIFTDYLNPIIEEEPPHFLDIVFPDFSKFPNDPDEFVLCDYTQKEEKTNDEYEEYERWIKAHPPRRKDTPTAYYKKFTEKFTIGISIIKLSKILKNIGYVKRHSGSIHYWD